MVSGGACLAKQSAQVQIPQAYNFLSGSLSHVAITWCSFVDKKCQRGNYSVGGDSQLWLHGISSSLLYICEQSEEGTRKREEGAWLVMQTESEKDTCDGYLDYQLDCIWNVLGDTSG